MSEVVTVGFGLLGIILGTAFHLGWDRRWTSVLAADVSAYIRFAPFALLPGGLGFVAAGLGFAINRAYPDAPIGQLLVLGLPVAILVVACVVPSPPRKVVPRWVMDAGLAPGKPSVGDRAVQIVFVTMSLLGVITGFAVVITRWIRA